MKNFQVTAMENGMKYWISPSYAVCCIVLSLGAGETKVLAHKRGTGCPNEVGKWSVNCGFVDWYETLEDAAIREVFEEVGFRISTNQLSFVGYNNPSKTEPNLTLRFVAFVSQTDLELAMVSHTINNNTIVRGGEKDEVDEIKLIPISEITQYNWAFNHDKVIESVLTNSNF